MRGIGSAGSNAELEVETEPHGDGRPDVHEDASSAVVFAYLADRETATVCQASLLEARLSPDAQVHRERRSTRSGSSSAAR
jgi:hypothetical protein